MGGPLTIAATGSSDPGYLHGHRRVLRRIERSARTGRYPEECCLVDPGWSTPAASALPVPTCMGKPVTIMVPRSGEVVHGTPGPDVILGTRGADEFYARGAAQIESAVGAAPTSPCAGDGGDRVSAGPGNDTLHIGPGHDRLRGDSGDDLLRAGWGEDGLAGGPGLGRLARRPGRRFTSRRPRQGPVVHRAGSREHHPPHRGRGHPAPGIGPVRPRGPMSSTTTCPPRPLSGSPSTWRPVWVG